MHVEGFTGPFVSDAARVGMLEAIHGSELSVDQPNRPYRCRRSRAPRAANDHDPLADHSTIAKEVSVALEATPLLEWEWKVLTLPRGADLRERPTSDTTGHLFVIWPRFPALLRSRLIGYVWDSSLPVGSIVKSRKTSSVTFIVVRRGEDGLGQWLPERRNVVDDHRRVFGEAPDNPQALALSIDTNDTRSVAATRFARIAFARA